MFTTNNGQHDIKKLRKKINKFFTEHKPFKIKQIWLNKSLDIKKGIYDKTCVEGDKVREQKTIQVKPTLMFHQRKHTIDHGIQITNLSIPSLK